MEDVVVGNSLVLASWVYVVGIALGLIAVGYAVWRLKRLLTQPQTYGITREEVAKRWKGIRTMGEQSPMAMKLAIMEADTLLDSALKSLTMPGKTLGERLRSASYKYPHLEKAWSAHRLRNQIVHEASYQLSMSDGHRALDEYEHALKVLNLL